MDHRIIIVTVKMTPAANRLLVLLHRQHVKLTKLHVTDEQLIFQMNKKDLPALKRARRQSKAHVTLQYDETEAVLQRTWVTVLGLLLCILVPIFASQFIWRVEVKGATPEIAKEVSSYLQQVLQIEEPIRAARFPAEMTIRQQLMAAFPEIAWVRFDKQETSIQLDLQLAPKTEWKQVTEKNHLVARTSGVITHYFLTAGKIAVAANQTVYEGDLLASGMLEAGEQQVVTGANGEVFADYWLETSFTLPRQMKYYTSNEPEWVWVQDDEPALEEVPLPIWLKKYVRLVKRQTYTYHEKLLEEQDMDTLLLPLLQQKIIQQLPEKTTVKSEKILHLTFDNDTVKGQVLYLVNENIAKPIPIIIEQGD